MKIRSIYELDETDRMLLHVLQDDAKVSLKELGLQIGLTASSVMERVRKLEAAEVITGYHTRVNARRIGLDIGAFIGVSVSSPQATVAVEQWVDAEPEVQECHHITGGHTLMLKVKTTNTEALELLIRRIRSLSGVASTETMLVLSTRLERFSVPLGGDDEVDEDNDDSPNAPNRRARRVGS